MLLSLAFALEAVIAICRPLFFQLTVVGEQRSQFSQLAGAALQHRFHLIDAVEMAVALEESIDPHHRHLADAVGFVEHQSPIQLFSPIELVQKNLQCLAAAV